MPKEEILLVAILMFFTLCIVDIGERLNRFVKSVSKKKTMTKKFRTGQKVWTWRYHAQDNAIKVEEMVYQQNDGFMEMHELKTIRNNTVLQDYNRVFHTKQECIDHIINSIKVIPYEDKTSV